MAYKQKGNPFSEENRNNRKEKRAKRIVRKHVSHTTVDSPTYGTKKSHKKFPRSEKKMMKADKLLKKVGYSFEEREDAGGASGYHTAMEWAKKNNSPNDFIPNPVSNVVNAFKLGKSLVFGGTPKTWAGELGKKAGKKIYEHYDKKKKLKDDSWIKDVVNKHKKKK